TAAAVRWVRMLASAPTAVSRPDHIIFFTSSFSIRGSVVTARDGAGHDLDWVDGRGSRPGLPPLSTGGGGAPHRERPAACVRGPFQDDDRRVPRGGERVRDRVALR